MKLPEALYHYTVGPKLPLIAASRRLEPAGFGLALSRREKPVLWFSENSQWEPTANKAMSSDGGRTFRRPSMRELRDTLGLYRFRLDTRNPAALNTAGIKVFPWTRAGLVAHIDPTDVARMVKSGLELGSTPSHWWGVLEPVPVSLEVSGLLRLEALHIPESGNAAESGSESGEPGEASEAGGTWMPLELTQAVAQWESKGLRIRQAKASETPRARGI